MVSLNDDSLVYYGSTCDTLAKRKSNHKAKFKQGKRSTSSYKLFEAGNVEIYLVLSYPCENIDELNKKEGEYILANDCVNKRVAGRDCKKYHEDNKETINKRHKEYYKKNKKTINEKNRTIKECACGKTYTMSNFKRHCKTKHHIKTLS